MLDNLLKGENIVVCVKDLNGAIVDQNEACSRLCGNHTGSPCKLGCMEFQTGQASLSEKAKRFQVLNGRSIHGKFFDVLYINSKEHHTTVLYPVETTDSDIDTLAEAHELTPRELEIGRLIQRGFTNREIMKKLFISKATLKTHINRIYRKLGVQKNAKSRAFLNRLAD